MKTERKFSLWGKSMRDVNRIKPFLNEVEKLWTLCPDLRFGQLIYMIASKMDKDSFIPEEDEWIKHIRDIIDEQVK